MNHLSKKLFWRLTFPRGISATTHTKMWHLYVNLDEKQKQQFLAAIASMPRIREDALY